MQSVSNELTYVRLDIGAGQHKMTGWTGMDRIASHGIDVVHDLLDTPWPFEDESVAEARAEHVLEHLPVTCWCCKDKPDALFLVVDEVYRVLRPNAKFHIIAPHSDSPRAWGDPTHTRGINRLTLFYFNREMRKQLGVDHYPVRANFDTAYEYTVNERGDRMDIRATLTKLP